jgi:ABC-2 type transport system ATP-binding protein
VYPLSFAGASGFNADENRNIKTRDSGFNGDCTTSKTVLHARIADTIDSDESEPAEGASMDTAISCINLVKTYGGRPPVEAVRGIDLQVERGECFGLLGPNGAGKTTTIEILEGLLEPTSGDVQVLGLRWDDGADAIRQQTGISLQETQLSDKLTVLETLTLFRSFYRRGIDAVVAIERVSLEEKANTWVQKLSGGQRQRLAVATALVGDPTLLFLDEPTTGLDPQSRRQLWELIRSARGEGRTIMLTTHYMEEAERLCDRVAIVDHGRVIAQGTPRELIAGLGGEHVIDFALEGEEAVSSVLDWSDLPSVSEFRSDNGSCQLSTTEPHVVLPHVLDRIAARSLRLATLTIRHASLEDVFVKLTGRQLDGDEEATS